MIYLILYLWCVGCIIAGEFANQFKEETDTELDNGMVFICILFWPITVPIGAIVKVQS